MYNVKFLFLAISLIHQLTTPKVQRRMSEGLAKDKRRKVTEQAQQSMCPPRWRKLVACAQFKIQNS